MMRYVAQELPYSCGVACLAMVTGRCHADLLPFFEPSIHERQGITEFHIEEYLAQHGFSWQRIYKVFQGRQGNTPRSAWPPAPWAERHICMVRVPTGNHFTVMDGEGRVLDPFNASRTSLAHPDYLDVYQVSAVYPGASRALP